MVVTATSYPDLLNLLDSGACPLDPDPGFAGMTKETDFRLFKSSSRLRRLYMGDVWNKDIETLSRDEAEALRMSKQGFLNHEQVPLWIYQ
ncbi:MAG: hypothetical protein JRJ70_16925 [Deltaproteobacteria bacterium]|nr:hypothetical protein [Deltaproteobacteria bacterium]